MFSKIRTMRSTEDYSDKIRLLKEKIKSADAVLIGAGAGLSASAGLTYSGERFGKYFSDFKEKYGISDMYAGGFYPFDTLEEFWAWWSRLIYINRYSAEVGKVYSELLTLVKDKNYFVLTTNVDHQFQRAGVDKNRLFYTQGDYGLWQCPKPCHNRTYDNEAMVREMVEKQNNMKIPSDLIPHCPVCGEPMTMNLRCDNSFVQDDGWYRAADRYDKFIHTYENSNILFLELGVGRNTPGIIKYPFWRMTASHANAVYACINYGEAVCPDEIHERSICIDGDIHEVLNGIL